MEIYIYCTVYCSILYSILVHIICTVYIPYNVYYTVVCYTYNICLYVYRKLHCTYNICIYTVYYTVYITKYGYTVYYTVRITYVQYMYRILHCIILQYIYMYIQYYTCINNINTSTSILYCKYNKEFLYKSTTYLFFSVFEIKL